MKYCSNMGGSRNYHTKWRKSDRERKTPHDITYIWGLKYDTNELILNQKQTHRHSKQTYGYQNRKGLGEG